MLDCVAELRRASGQTQDEFAASLDVACKYLQRVDAGHENLTIATLVNLASNLGVEVSEFFLAAAGTIRRPGRPKKPQ